MADVDYGSTKQEERGRLLYSLEYDGAHSEVTKTAAGGTFFYLMDAAQEQDGAVFSSAPPMG